MIMKFTKHYGLITNLMFITFMGASSMSHSIEEPEYELIDTVSKVEIRQYAPSIQAVTNLAGNKESSGGFRRLAGFIFGGNDNGQSISMTAPVQETLGVDEPKMAFTMPKEFTLESLPNPKDSSISLFEVPSRTMAVVRFSGWATSGKVKRYTKKLKSMLAENGVDVSGEISLNQYNPPWTLPFMRRNEIMLEIEWSPSLNDNTVMAF
jgi:hypothetical protein